MGAESDGSLSSASEASQEGGHPLDQVLQGRASSGRPPAPGGKRQREEAAGAAIVPAAKQRRASPASAAAAASGPPGRKPSPGLSRESGEVPSDGSPPAAARSRRSEPYSIDDDIEAAIPISSDGGSGATSDASESGYSSGSGTEGAAARAPLARPAAAPLRTAQPLRLPYHVLPCLLVSGATEDEEDEDAGPAEAEAPVAAPRGVIVVAKGEVPEQNAEVRRLLRMPR